MKLHSQIGVLSKIGVFLTGSQELDMASPKQKPRKTTDKTKPAKK